MIGFAFGFMLGANAGLIAAFVMAVQGEKYATELTSDPQRLAGAADRLAPKC